MDLKHLALQPSKSIYFFIFYLLSFVHAQGQPYYFRHYTVENGLSNNAVMCSLQDKTGFLWFGTKDGLNRFDGYNFKTFRKKAGNPGSIGNNFIRSLYEDKEGLLWVGTENGLYQYLKSTETFTLISATANLSVRKLVQDSIGNFWFISGFNLCRYMKVTGKVELYDHRNYFVATAICITRQGIVSLGTNDGSVKIYNAESNSFSSLDLFEHSKPIRDKYIEELCLTQNGAIMAGTHNGIKILDLKRNTYTDILQPFDAQQNMFVRTIMQTTANEFWLGTENGTIIYNQATEKSVHLQKNYNDPFSLTDDIIHTICRDSEGGIWIGSYFGGINYYPKPYTPFKKFFPQKGENSLSGNIAREIKKDHYGNLWIGTEDAGLNKYDPSSGKFTHYKIGGASKVNIHGLLVSGDELWIGTFDQGLYVMNINTGKVIRNFRVGVASDLTINFIYCLYETREGQILIGTPLGIYTYNRRKDHIERFKGLPAWDWYSSMIMDRKGTIWAATLGKGVHFYNPVTGKAGSFRHNDRISYSLSNDRVNAIFKDSKNNLWFATECGLCKLNETGEFIRYGTADGFPGDFMLSMEEDNEGNLWITTIRGLVRFHLTSGKLQVYTTVNGILSDQFNFNSAFKDIDGTMYFGSVKGLISFKPEDFNQNTIAPPVLITGLQVYNEEAAIGLKGSALQKSVTYTDEITLSHHQSTFTITFAALSFTTPEMTTYYYQMEGLSEKWIPLKASRKVSFTELPPGNYVFRAKAMNNNGIESRKVTKLAIRVLPPWWKSTWAFITYTLLAMLFIFYMVRSYHIRTKQKTRQKIELLEMEKEKEILKLALAKEKEILQAKIEFFTNVAHEIKTPLTLINAPLAKVIEKVGNVPEIERSLIIMERNTNRLIDLTNQLLDFRLVEMEQFHLSFKRTNISALLTDVYNGFIILAGQKNISISLNLPEAPFFATIDVDAFNKIIYNLVGNAVKYAVSQVYINLLPRYKNSMSFTIVIKNDGYLIPDQFNEKIFEPFFRIREIESQTGTGIGLALSRSLTDLHNGSLVLEPAEDNMNVFSLTLPINQETDDATNKSQRAQ